MAQKDEAARERQREQRRQSEDLYRTGPEGDPALIDEHLYGASSRDAEGMAWARVRIQALGFMHRRDGRIHSFVKEAEGYMVYADPRPVGRIVFRVFKLPCPRQDRHGAPDHASFFLKDEWRLPRSEKFERRLVDAVRQLQPEPER